MKRILLTAQVLLAAAPDNAQDMPIFDARTHYSHDAVKLVPPKEPADLLRKAGVRKALVSSSDDDGTQKLHAAAPDIVVPSLRPIAAAAKSARGCVPAAEKHATERGSDVRPLWILTILSLLVVASRADAVDCAAAATHSAHTRGLASPTLTRAAKLSPAAPKVGEPLHVDLALCAPAIAAIDRTRTSTA